MRKNIANIGRDYARRVLQTIRDNGEDCLGDGHLALSALASVASLPSPLKENVFVRLLISDLQLNDVNETAQVSNGRSSSYQSRYM